MKNYGNQIRFWLALILAAPDQSNLKLNYLFTLERILKDWEKESQMTSCEKCWRESGGDVDELESQNKFATGKRST